MVRLQRGSTTVDVSAERAEVLRSRGYEDVESDPPAQSETKDVWVDYAKTRGYDEDEGLTKQELIETYGG